ncbi:MAG: EamA/RhaT family transporter [Oceanospirillaceae bacterium]|jgi:drug/metabolite transporter (DMT)-like permease|uniref:DMT family transporter n=1 Tax=Marinobacterium litorale TaxID=404770 RepID=UPI0003F7E85D|nr:DMT family transporter [Marinobacterium litorale]MBS97449.1 EamA/RhaT family transporter [Oceanospirillaceae bacterium]
MPYLLLVLTVLFWAGNVVSARAIHVEMGPLTLAFLRWGLVLLLVLPWALPRIWRNREIIRRNWLILLVLSILSVGCFNTFIYIGLQNTTASNATLMQSAAPVIILLLSALLFKEPIKLRQWAGVVTSLIGVAILISQADLSVLLGLNFNTGDIWVATAILTWSCYSVALRWRPADLDGFTLFSFNVLVGVIALAPFALMEQGQSIEIHWSPAVISAILYMAIFPSILSYMFWNKGVAELGAARAGLFIHLMPLFGVILSVVFLGETLQLFHAAGMLLIFTGIYLATVSQTLSKLRRS